MYGEASGYEFRVDPAPYVGGEMSVLYPSRDKLGWDS
jgi:hypothetical protein